METFLHLLSPAYLFARSLGPFTSNLGWLFLGFNIFLIILGFIIRAGAAQKDIFAQKGANKFYALGWTMGMIGIILWSFRQLGAFYISAPIGLLIWLSVFIIWLIFVFYYLLIKAPQRRKDLKMETEKRKYLS